jgi:hypothetical protein
MAEGFVAGCEGDAWLSKAWVVITLYYDPGVLLVDY